jgi:hypothetical protein
MSTVEERLAVPPLESIRRPRDKPIWKLEAALKCRSCKKGRYAPAVHVWAIRKTSISANRKEAA